jgi:hypothetical protein
MHGDMDACWDMVLMDVFSSLQLLKALPIEVITRRIIRNLEICWARYVSM